MRRANERLELTRSAMVTAAAALAAQPRCSAGSDAAGGTTAWRNASAFITTQGRPADRASLGFALLGSGVQRRWLAVSDHVTRRFLPRHRAGEMLLGGPASSWRYPGTSRWPAVRGRAALVRASAWSVELWLQNEALEQTRSAMVTAAAALAAQRRCSTDE